MDDNLSLVFVNVIGKDYKGLYLYEFLFSDNTKNIDGENWDVYPASGRPEPPNEKFIKKVGRLKTELKFDVIQNSDTFSFWDTVDGVIALCWENLDDYDEYPDKRLCFHFNENIKSVEDKLYQQDNILKYNKIDE